MLIFFGVPFSTDTKDGQKPSKQLKSLLHDDWLIFLLRPYSVSNGSTEMQLDALEKYEQWMYRN